MRFHNGEDAQPRGDTPAHGQHTVEEMRKHGYSDAEINGLREAGVIKG